MKLTAYPRYKPSGVEWLGDVPEHWEVNQLGYLVSKIGSGKTPRGGADVYQSDGVMLIRSQNVYATGLRLEDVVFVDESVDEEMAGTRVRPRDVLLNITGASLGRCAIAPHSLPKANVNQHVCIIRPTPDRADASFIHRSMTSLVVQSQILGYENGSSREGLNFQQVRKLVLALPPLAEQQAIAGFLDQETGRVDRLVVKKQELVERLKEKRTALISRTVTRGLPAEAGAKAGLPVNPPLKHSGLDSVPDIPSDWTVSKVWLERVACNIEYQDGNHGELHPKAEDYVNDGIPFIMANHIVGGQINFKICNYIEPEMAESLRIGFAHTGDVLLTHKGTIGRVGMVQENRFPYVMLTPQVTYYRSLRNLTPRFIFWFFQGKLWQDQMHLVSSLGTTRGYVGLLDQRPLNLFRPPLQEQVAIASYLDAETAKLDALMAKVETAIERLQEYRTALITAVVTGKIDVRTINQP